MNLRPLLAGCLDALFTLGDCVQLATYCRPAGFNSATGRTAPAPLRVPIRLLRSELRGQELLLAAPAEDEQKILIPAADLAPIGEPWPGDYLIEQATGCRRDILAARPDSFGILWTLRARRSPHEDYETLEAATESEDCGSLDEANAFADYGNLS